MCERRLQLTVCEAAVAGIRMGYLSATNARSIGPCTGEELKVGSSRHHHP